MKNLIDRPITAFLARKLIMKKKFYEHTNCKSDSMNNYSYG